MTEILFPCSTLPKLIGLARLSKQNLLNSENIFYTAMPAKTQDKRKGLQAAGNIEPANIEQYRALAADARRGLHEFASDVLNLVAECARAEGDNWDTFKVQIPGYRKAMAERRKRAALEILTAPETAKEAYDDLTPEERAELDAKLKEIQGRRGPTKSKTKAS